MKRYFTTKILCFCCAIGFGNLAMAQVTIKSAMMPASGQNIIYSTSNDTIDLSKTGPNTTWDFSGITPVSQDTFKYMSPGSANLLYSLSFFGDVALEVKTGGQPGVYQFFKTNSSDYRHVGMGISIPITKPPVALPINYSSPDIIYRFPLAYGSKDDSCSYEGSASFSTFTIQIKGKRKNTVDGWGTVKTPYKTYNCIRVKSVVAEEDTILIAPVNNNRVEYKWLSTTEQIPVIEAIVTTSAITGKPTMVLYYRDSYKNNINPNGPMVDFNVPDPNVYTKDTISFNNLTTKGLAYNWTIIPSTRTFVPGSGATSKNPKVIFNAPGLYSVSLTATNPAGSNTVTKKNYINATHNSGINSSVNPEMGISFYPNPARAGFYVHFDDNPENGITALSIANIFGQEIFRKNIQASQNDEFIRLSGIAPGIYVILCKNNKGSYLEKIVVQ